MLNRKTLGNSKRWVIKIGSSLVTDDGRGIDKIAIARWSKQMMLLRDAGTELLLVSSGAVAEGISRLGWDKRPRALNELQAAAAVGQMGLVQHYESCFQAHGIHTAQVLLTHDDLSNRQRYLNARSTLRTLLEMGAIPVINENDTVTTDEIRLGDNDTLASMVANLIEADLLVILTDQNGLYDSNPRTHKTATLVDEARASDASLIDMAGTGLGELGRGGMRTKVLAAQRAARSGTATIIASGKQDNILVEISKGKKHGTLLLPDSDPLAARKQWLAGQLNSCGQLHLDDGAVEVLRKSGKSLLPVGVTKVTGEFQRGELVSCLTPGGVEFARGLVNYTSGESAQLCGKASAEIESILGYVDESELIHRDNLVVL